jgi:membrane associated rhomboid family serine protease
MDSLFRSLQDFFPDTLLSDLYFHGQILGGWIIALWVIEILDQYIFRQALDQFGIIPRQQVGLRGIVFAPCLHGGFKHLSANTMPLLVLGWFVLVDGPRTFGIVTSVIWVFGGLAVWLFGRSRSNHIGASGVIFGYLGYVLLRGYLIRSWGAIALAVIAGLLYGSIIWSVLPLRRESSWEGHLFGFLSGGLAAYYLQDIAAFLYQQFGV